MQSDYVYCGDEDKGWEIFESDEIYSSAALGGLYDSGTLSGSHRVRRARESKWRSLEEVKEVTRRIGYGQLLPKIFSNRWCWYEGRSGEKQGPVNGRKMIIWFKMGYLYEQMKICVVSDPEEIPKDEEFLSLENLLRVFSQPVFADTALANRKPIADVRLLHCALDVCSVFVGEIEDIRQLPKHLPRLSDRSDDIQPDRLELIKDAGQKIIDGLSDRASKLFCNNGVVWYYLGQGSRPTIHGPYDGVKMSVWFRKGWLSLDLCIWSTEDIANPINIKQFRKLGDVLTPRMDHNIQ